MKYSKKPNIKLKTERYEETHLVVTATVGNKSTYRLYFRPRKGAYSYCWFRVNSGDSKMNWFGGKKKMMTSFLNAVQRDLRKAK